MPTFGRGTAVLHVGDVTGCQGKHLFVDIGGETYLLPFLSGAPTSGEVWVLFVGRTGLVLGEQGSCPE